MDERRARSDRRRRELERRWFASGSGDDAARLLHERLRAGDLTPEALRLAAYLDHSDAERARALAGLAPLELPLAAEERADWAWDWRAPRRRLARAIEHGGLCAALLDTFVADCLERFLEHALRCGPACRPGPGEPGLEAVRRALEAGRARARGDPALLAAAAEPVRSQGQPLLPRPWGTLSHHYSGSSSPLAATFALAQLAVEAGVGTVARAQAACTIALKGAAHLPDFRAVRRRDPEAAAALRAIAALLEGDGERVWLSRRLAELALWGPERAPRPAPLPGALPTS